MRGVIVFEFMGGKGPIVEECETYGQAVRLWRDRVAEWGRKGPQYLTVTEDAANEHYAHVELPSGSGWSCWVERRGG